ncbi:hypothetical protein SDC9_60984 [bioreactor metagenome]|uniref:Uncharacterized protein n=1 Tax=bioreactor metagenome TaxID=1076179 RepID=A0A644XEG7_9ZZZZ
MRIAEGAEISGATAPAAHGSTINTASSSAKRLFFTAIPPSENFFAPFFRGRFSPMQNDIELVGAGKPRGSLPAPIK